MLIDRIIKSGEEGPGRPTWLESFLLARLKEAEVVLADNVAQYLYGESSKDDWDIERDFPNVAPPFPTMFIEYSLPRQGVSERLGALRSADGPVKKVGVLIISCQIEEGGPELRWLSETVVGAEGGGVSELEPRLLGLSRDVHWLGDLQDGCRGGDRVLDESVLSWRKRIKDCGQALGGGQRLRWVCAAYSFLETQQGIGFPNISLSWLVRDDGKPTLPGGKMQAGITDRELIETLSADESLRDLVIGGLSLLLHVPLLTLSFMNCKNVAVETVAPPARLNGARLKRGHPPLAAYKILKVHPTLRTVQGDGDPGPADLERALHICRGHFKDYSGGRGLFGRLSGVFWWDMAARGSQESGVVLKDYEVRTDKPLPKTQRQQC